MQTDQKMFLTSKVGSLIDIDSRLILSNEPVRCPQSTNGGESSQRLREVGIDGGEGHCGQPLQFPGYEIRMAEN